MCSHDTQTVGRHTHLADSDSDDESRVVLTLAKASDLCPKPYRLVARNQNITSLADLSTLTFLDYIDLTSNSLTSLDGIHHPRLKTLIVSKNKLTQLRPIYKASTIRILNVSENQLPDLEWLPHTTFAAHLLTLVASSNRIHSLEGLTTLSSLHTLVISSNQVEDITPIVHLKSLVKLSMSKNQIRILPSLASLEQLVELRLAHNRIASLPNCRLSKLKILDVGHNRLSEIQSLRTFAPELVQVNLRENPACRRDNFHEYVKGLCNNLEVIDLQRIAGGRRKVRVNRIRKAVGFDIEHDRKFARMPSDYYLRHLKQQDSVENNVNKEKKGEESKKKRMESDEEQDVKQDVAVDAEEFVEMARAKSQNGQARGGSEVKVHGRRDGDEGKKGERKRRKLNEGSNDRRFVGMESFGDGGASRW